jgi:signal transduction histidine kinase
MGQGRELWGLSKDGRRIPVEVALNPIDGEEETNILASVVDISERHRVQVERERLLREAQNSVKERDQFLSIASHELRTPLTTLRLTVQALHRQLNRSEAQEVAPLRKRVLAAQRQTERLEWLVERLLDVSRMTEESFGLEPTRVDLSRIVREVVERFAHSDEPSANGIRLEAISVLGEWDPNRVDQVVTNLIANALRYGEGKPVAVAVVDRGKTAEVLVRDQGCGIEPKQQRKIFERFGRASSNTSQGGFGLGLWIAREIVEAHGGRISVESRLGKGATFTVSLPKRLPS